MKLESLLLCNIRYDGSNTDISTILSKQRKLKSLLLIIDLVDEGLLDVVTNQ